MKTSLSNKAITLANQLKKDGFKVLPETSEFIILNKKKLTIKIR